jgi:hypothetical protein
MAGAHFLARRSGRAALALLAVIAGYISVTHALAQATGRQNSDLAVRLAPSDGGVLARRALSLSASNLKTADRRRADMLARKALLRDPTAVPALVALGLNAEVRGDHRTATRLFAYSQALSRRSFETQLWAIEDAVQRNDVRGALRHYDAALRTSGRGANLLFPVLASAASDAAIRGELARTLATKPNWGGQFVEYLAANNPDPMATADLFVRLRAAKVELPQLARSQTVNALVENGIVSEAWRFYRLTHAGADRRMSRDPRFLAGEDAPSVFDWQPINDASVSTSIQRGERGGLFDFAAPASMGGPLLQQMQILPPGVYRLTGHSIGLEQEPRSLPYWTLSCRRGGRELGRVDVPNSSRNQGRFAGLIVVPADCPVQVLTLFSRASDAVSGVSGQIDYVQLAPATLRPPSGAR